MAYESRNLSVLAYANGFTLWHYVTNDEWEQVIKTGYFGMSAADLMDKGDMILVVASDRTGQLSVVERIRNQSVTVKTLITASFSDA